MAKDTPKKNPPKKDITDLSLDDLNARLSKSSDKIKNLRDDKKSADTPAEKKAIQQSIDQLQDNRSQIKNTVSTKTDIKQPTYEELAAAIYASPAYQTLSDANKQLIQSQVDLLTVDELQKLNPSKKQVELMYQQAKNSVVKKDKSTGSFKNVKKQLDQTFEEQKRADVDNLQAGIALIQNDVNMTQDQKNMAMRDLQIALDEAKSQYEIAATRQNEYLQTQLADTQAELDLTLGRADEDKVLELRQLERQYNTQLRDTQDNMTQRGLAVSGIRARAENELAGTFEDSRTTSEIEADRKKEDARIKAEQYSRDINTLTSQNLQDLITQYTGVSRNAVQGAESVLGTAATQPLLDTANNINGTDVNSYLYGNLTGSANAQSSAQQKSLHDYYANFEKTYGTKALKNKFGNGTGVIGATTDYAGYTPIGNLVGSSANVYKQGLKANKENKNTNIEQIVQDKKNQYTIGKLL